MKLSGLPSDEIKTKNVNVGVFKGQPVYLHTMLLGNHLEGNKPLLVLVHGYGASGVCFFSLFKELTKRFRVITVDLPGFGGSSRLKDYDYDTFDSKQTVDHYTNLMDIWRQQLGLDKFYLTAHSFGGYIAGEYAVKNPERIIKLLLLSPVGIRHSLEYEALSDSEKKELFMSKNKRFAGIRIYTRLLRHFLFFCWTYNFPLFCILRMINATILLFVLNFLTMVISLFVDPELASAYRDIFYYCVMMPGSGDYAMTITHDINLYSREVPLGHPSKLGNS